MVEIYFPKDYFPLAQPFIPPETFFLTKAENILLIVVVSAHIENFHTNHRRIMSIFHYLNNKKTHIVVF